MPPLKTLTKAPDFSAAHVTIVAALTPRVVTPSAKHTPWVRDPKLAPGSTQISPTATQKPPRRHAQGECMATFIVLILKMHNNMT